MGKTEDEPETEKQLMGEYEGNGGEQEHPWKAAINLILFMEEGPGGRSSTSLAEPVSS